MAHDAPLIGTTPSPSIWGWNDHRADPLRKTAELEVNYASSIE